VIALSPRAEAQVDELLAYFERLDRLQAVEKLAAALERASGRIVRAPNAGLAAPRPYPRLAQLGFLWVKDGPYWFAYMIEPSPIIVGVYHEAADIPNRV
jgi:plasmid stabilization system protein ParE